MDKEKMKKLKDIAYIKQDHFIIDCCPDSEPDEQYNTLRTNPITGHTAYINIGILSSILLDDKEYKIKCKKCQTEYKITEDTLYDAIEKANKKHKK
jgi:hypothetical protein